MKDLGAAKKILSIEITRDRKSGKLYLSHRGYIEKVLHRFNMHNAKPVSTPLAAHFRLSSDLCPQSDHEIEYMSRVPYSSAVGSLMYAMVCSRPDLSHALSVVSRFMANPGKEHWRVWVAALRLASCHVRPSVPARAHLREGLGGRGVRPRGLRWTGQAGGQPAVATQGGLGCRRRPGLDLGEATTSSEMKERRDGGLLNLG